jgi:hypothetical protein
MGGWGDIKFETFFLFLPLLTEIFKRLLMNKANTIKKIALVASISLAAALAFSCSSEGEEANEPSSSSVDISSSSSSGDGQGGGSSSSSGGGGDNSDGSIILKRIYALGNISDSTFEYFETAEWYDCYEGGVIRRWIDDYPDSVFYSVSNNILVLQDKWWDDTLHFSGTSNNLIGTWARAKNRKSNMIKAEFTEDTLKYIYDYCIADEIDKDEQYGWKIVSTGCNTYEYHKGDEKVAAKVILSNKGEIAQNLTYNGKTCYWDQDFTFSRSQAACAKAWDKAQAEGGHIELYYYTILNSSEVEKCMDENGFPRGFWGEDDENEESAMPKTLMKKAKVKAKMLKM